MTSRAFFASRSSLIAAMIGATRALARIAACSFVREFVEVRAQLLFRLAPGVQPHEGLEQQPAARCRASLPALVPLTSQQPVIHFLNRRELVLDRRAPARVGVPADRGRVHQLLFEPVHQGICAEVGGQLPRRDLQALPMRKCQPQPIGACR